ncbi:Reverse transcriptase, RNA-dependent DNA polymerase [Ascosphaera apis ARSEF 7405]|uniref:Reverse transcriptase, RNA-dependent DNA polymerase n=1 Tax=Ascosphaera apis ARSEF 7405 TaxID=392613 RepID=A0A167Z0N2_9EURO|nr:Reverse transcriptase, RNA-dependent DNA polymerase [Ascosphaera apis ARSEF 7405]
MPRGDRPLLPVVSDPEAILRRSRRQQSSSTSTSLLSSFSVPRSSPVSGVDRVSVDDLDSAESGLLPSEGASRVPSRDSTFTFGAMASPGPPPPGPPRPQSQPPGYQELLQMVLQLKAQQEEAAAPPSGHCSIDFMDDWSDAASWCSRQISQFHAVARTLGEMPILHGPATFDAWNSSLRNHAVTLKATKVLDGCDAPALDHPTRPMWRAVDSWLKAHIWDSIAPAAQRRLNPADDATAAQVYALVKGTFQEREDARALRLLSSLINMTAGTPTKVTDRAFIERLQLVKAQLDPIIPLPDPFYYNCLRMGMSIHTQAFIQDKMDRTIDLPRADRTDHNLVQLLEQLMVFLPTGRDREGTRDRETARERDIDRRDPLVDRSRPATLAAEGKSSLKRTLSAPTPRRSSLPSCSVCAGPHTIDDCWTVHPEKSPSQWQRYHMDNHALWKAGKPVPKWTPKDSSLTSANTLGDVQAAQANFVAVDDSPDEHTGYSAVANMASADGSTPTSEQWVLDSGTSHHLTPLPLLHAVESPGTITMANKSQARYTEFGKFHLRLAHGGSVVLNDVRRSPTMATNLISLGKLMDEGWDLSHYTLDGVHRMLCTAPDRSVVLEGVNTGGIYIVKTASAEASDLLDQDSAPAPFLAQRHASRPRVDTLQNWHRRLGHMNTAYILKLAGTPGSGISIAGPRHMDFCTVCRQAKQSATPFTTRNRITVPGFRLFLDIAGGGDTLLSHTEVPTFGDRRYLIVVTDDATRYRWASTLHKKSDAAAYIKWVVNHIGNLGRKVGIIFSDGAKEFASNDLLDFYTSRGIDHHTTVPYTSQQNGVAERSIRTVMEKVRSLLHDSDLPRQLWGEAAFAAIKMINCSPTVTILYGVVADAATPYEAWTGVKPTFEWLHLWGCHAWTKVGTSDKLESRAKPFRLVGWKGNHIFKLWVPDTPLVVYARNVSFDEGFGRTQAMLATIEDANTDQRDIESSLHELRPLDDWRSLLLRRVSEHYPHVLTDLAHNGLQALPDDFKLEDREDHHDSGMDLTVLSTYTDIPTTMKDVLASPDKDHWLKAMADEVDNMKSRGVYEEVEWSPEMKVISGKFVYDRKTNPEGATLRFKARWVVRGCFQQKGIHYNRTFAAVVNPTTNLAIHIIALALLWHVEFIDFVSAFLNGALPELLAIYMQLPPRGRDRPIGSRRLVGRLRQALYGLKQAAYIWYETASQLLLALGFYISPYDAGLFIHSTKDLWLSMYVDDCKIIAKNKDDATWLKQEISKHFEIKEVTSNVYLGQSIEDHEDYVKIHQGL